jgi:hypothetical protein
MWRIAVVLIAGGLAYHATAEPIDYAVYYHGARGVFEGIRPVYGVWSGMGWPMHYRYPPLFLLLFTPLAMLPMTWGAALWVVMKMAALAGLLQKFREGVLKTAPVWIVVALAGPYLIEEFRYGNAQFIVTALTAAGLLLVRQQPSLSAGTLALAISLKVWPLFFVPYLAARKDWKVVIWTLGLVIFFAVMPSVYFGFQGNLGLLQEWFSQEFQAQYQNTQAQFPNQSLRGLLTRYLTVIDYTQARDSNYRQVNVAALDPEVVRLLWLILAGTIYMAFLFVAHRRHKTDGWLDHGLAFSLLPLLQPFTQKYALSVLLWPAMAAGVLVARRRFSIPIFAAATLVMIQPLVPGAAAQRFLQVLGFDVAANALLAGALAAAAIKASDDSLESSRAGNAGEDEFLNASVLRP